MNIEQVEFPSSSQTAVVFGGHRFQAGDKIYEEVIAIGRLLAKNGYFVKSGGYAGLMEAVSKGAALAGGRPQGVGLKNWQFESKNQYIDEADFEEVEHVNLRSDRLLQGANLIVALPGGVGTLGEFFMAWTYLLMGFLPDNARIIMYGEGWQPLISQLPEHFAIDQHHTRQLHVCPDMNSFAQHFLGGKSVNHNEESSPDSDRWNSRAATWDDLLSDANSYVNIDDGYSRFDNFLVKCISKRTSSHSSLSCVDIGCGTGAALTALNSRLGGSREIMAVGLDFASEMLAHAKQKNEYADLLLADITCCELPEETYDLVYSRGITFTRFPTVTLQQVLSSVAKALRPDGLLVFDYLNQLWDDRVSATGKQRLSLPELENIVHSVGLRITDVEGMARRTINICCAKVV